MKEEVKRIKKLVGIDHNRWEQPCTCDKCKNMCKVPCIGTPKDIEAIIDAGYADRLKETMWMVGYLAVKEKPIAMIQPTEKDGWCAFRQPDGLCELHDRGLKPTEGVLASCKVIEEKPKYEFKPFDKVLVRKEGNKKWNISLFAREIVDDYNGLPYKYECSNGTLWDYCIHFEGNEHLLGTDEAL